MSEAPDGYRYVARGHLDAAVADLEQAYARYRTRIVSMIFEQAWLAGVILTERCAE